MTTPTFRGRRKDLKRLYNGLRLHEILLPTLRVRDQNDSVVCNGIHLFFIIHQY